jgi:septal ring factor EnvC (AmiA/AmiB activator)
MGRSSITLIAAILCLVASAAAAQDQGVQDRLRDALRRVTIDLRAAQDSQATLQASLDQVTKQRDLLQQQVTQLTEQLSAQPPQPVARPAVHQQQNQALENLKVQNAALQDGLAHWQTAYQQAASLARDKNAEAQQSAATATTTQRTLTMCETKNTKLLAAAEDIVHLYQSRQFRSLTGGPLDTFLGFKRVELQNIMQDKEDQILDQKYHSGEQPEAPSNAGASR